MSTSASRVRTVVNPVVGTSTNQTTVQSTEYTPMRQQRFTAAQLAKPDDVACQLNQMLDQIRDATLPARSNPYNQHILFAGRAFDLSLTISLTHNLGRKVQWKCTRWVDSNTGNGIYEPANGQADPNTLILMSSNGGTADIEVW